MEELDVLLSSQGDLHDGGGPMGPTHEVLDSGRKATRRRIRNLARLRRALSVSFVAGVRGDIPGVAGALLGAGGAPGPDVPGGRGQEHLHRHHQLFGGGGTG